MPKRKPQLPTPNLFRRWSVHGLTAEQIAARKASGAAIRHHVRQAAAYKARALAAVADPADMQRQCLYMQGVYRNQAGQSVHQIARQSLEYHRHRAFASVGARQAGSYAPEGWPIDRPMRDSWAALQAGEAVTVC